MPDLFKLNTIYAEDGKYKYRKKPKELLHKTFRQLLFAFRLNGIYYEEKEKRVRVKRKRLRHFAWKSIEYAFNIIAVLHLMTKLISVLFFTTEKEEITLIIHLIVLDLIRIFLLKKIEVIFEMIKKVLRISEHYVDLKTIKRIRCFNMSFFVLIALCMITFALEYYDNELYTNWSEFLKKRDLQELSEILNIILKALVMSFNYNSHIILILSAVLFADVCCVLERIFKMVYYVLKTSETEYENCNAIHSYLTILEVTEYVEKSYCSIVFIIALCVMIGLFRGFVILSFSKNLTFSLSTFLCIYIIGHLGMLFAIVLPASDLNQVAFEARSQVISLREHSPFSQNRDLKWRQMNVKRKVNLTLWNTYVIDRSLIWSAFGTLLTYGILIGTLGIVSDKIN
ncbi:hypothetical protein NPIL_474071 [Nephila pilipes]|uniref:Uncharacterized protein n=1 Tax=Nephila pilipes TaxID=299642 RepID=A0A8X6NQ15_NEPPI|nr:hypothetical protein NPIL_474071 [Nephila pilipes]